MVRRNSDGTLFVGEVVKDVSKADEPVVEQMELGEIIGDQFLIEEATKPKNKGGRPRKK